MMKSQITSRKAIIFGIKSTKLSFEEKKLIKKVKPWGIILFSRNIKSIEQAKLLVDSVKKIFNDKNYPILIDQEGGKVSRINKILDFSLFSQNYFGRLYQRNKKEFLNKYTIYSNTLGYLLKTIGININTVPVLDVKIKNSHKIIGSRSFSSKPSVIKKLGNLCIKEHSKNKIGTVIKHIPGHGCAKIDSHISTPIINASREKLIKRDFESFKNNRSFFAMTAHVIFNAYDKNNVSTHSKIVINKIIRKHIKFKGILISDDISMGALKYDLAKNATKALESGCNLVLHCNANIKEMRKLANIVPTINKFTQKKTKQFYNFLM